MKIRILIVTFICIAQVSFAQNNTRQSQREDIEAQKVAYITSALSLTPEEAQNFWPLYNAYRTELQAIRKSEKAIRKAKGNSAANLSDKEIDAEIKQGFASDRQKIDLDEKYYEQFKTVLSVSKVASFYDAERDFKRELLRSLKRSR